MEKEFLIPRFTQNEVATITGIKEMSLQNWTKRRLLSTADTGGGQGKHRRYSIMDVIAAEIMQRLVDLAVAPSEVAMFIGKIQSVVNAAVQGNLSENQPGTLFIYKEKNNVWQVVDENAALPESFICLRILSLFVSLNSKIKKFVELKETIKNVNAIKVSRDSVTGEMLFDGRTSKEVQELLKKTRQLLKKKKIKKNSNPKVKK